MKGRTVKLLPWVTLATVGAAACSGTTGKAADAATPRPTASTAASAPSPSQDPSRAPTPFGSVDSNPSDPVIALPTGSAPPDIRVPPQVGNLPVGWNLTAWSARVRAAVGTHPQPTSDPAPSTGWQVSYWSTSGVANLSVGVHVGSTGTANEVDCAAQGFDPADRSAAADVSALLTLCAKADFPGSEPATASAWAARQAAPLLGELKTMPHGQKARSASPTFGTGVYMIEAYYVTGYGNTIQIYIWGPAPR